MSKADKTRQLIVDKAARIFNQKGYAGTSMYDIVEATGLSKGGVYGNFRNKEAIAIAAFEHATKTVWRQVRERTAPIESYPDKLVEAIRFYKERVLNPPIEGGCPIQNMAVEMDDVNPEMRQKVVEAVDLWRLQVARTLEKGKEAGEIKADIDIHKFAIQFIGTLEGGILLAQLYKDVHFFEVLSEQLFQMIASVRLD
jgi:AcrR family transcriptional regulator